ncbi:MAG: FtsQ-type POTRA domain-containing protein [Armatimonadota bacterium]|nr:FtsQ-type POTRA domain-containing protein [Armatimonadota bacterium]
MGPIRGPVDYHSYPPRGQRGRRGVGTPPEAAPSAAPPSTAAGERRQQQRRQSDRRAQDGRAAASGDRAEAEAISDTWLPTDDTFYDDTFYPVERSRRGRRFRQFDRDARRGQAARARGQAGSFQPRRPLWKRVRHVAGVLCLVGVGELVAAGLTSSRCEVREVGVTGLGITPEAAVEPIKNELIGQNWLRAHVQEAVRAVAALPTVRAASVGRELSWPPRLTVHIEERQPFARVGVNRRWWIVDEEGVPFRLAGSEDNHLYAVTGALLQPQLGQPLPSAAWQPVVEFTAALSADARQGHSWSLRRIHIDPRGFASLRLTGGPQDEVLVRLGAGPWPEKLRRARQALAYFDATGRRAQALNFVSLKMPTWTPRRENALAMHDGRLHSHRLVEPNGAPG